MAAIIKTNYAQNVQGSVEALTYIDSINKESYMTEMYTICLKYLREKKEMDTNILHFEPLKRERLMAGDEKDIWYNKNDGYWIIETDNHTLTLYQRQTLVGKIYNSTLVDKLFTLTYSECSRTVPKVFEKTSPFDNFIVPNPSFSLFL